MAQPAAHAPHQGPVHASWSRPQDPAETGGSEVQALGESLDQSFLVPCVQNVLKFGASARIGIFLEPRPRGRPQLIHGVWGHGIPSSLHWSQTTAGFVRAKALASFDGLTADNRPEASSSLSGGIFSRTQTRTRCRSEQAATAWPTPGKWTFAGLITIEDSPNQQGESPGRPTPRPCGGDAATPSVPPRSPRSPGRAGAAR